MCVSLSACVSICVRRVCARTRVRARVCVSVSMPAYESFSIFSVPRTNPDRPPLRHPRRPNADRHQIHIDNKHNNIIAGDSPICPSRLQRLWNPILQSGFGSVWKQRTRQRLRRAAKAYGDHKVGRRTFMWQTRVEPSRGTLSFPFTPLEAALHLLESNPVRSGLGLLIDYPPSTGLFCKLQALVYDILPLEEGAGKRCSECGGVHQKANTEVIKTVPFAFIVTVCLVQTYKRLKRMVFIMAIKPQYLNFRCKPLFQATKHHLNNS